MDLIDHTQEALLAVTNAFEGTIFVNSNVVVNATQYSLELFPKFSTRQANAVGALYANVGDELFQVNAVQGECECISYLRHRH
jgi:hypothetical protein